MTLRREPNPLRRVSRLVNTRISRDDAASLSIFQADAVRPLSLVRHLSPVVALIGLFVGVPAAFAGPAIGQFEVKDLESEPGDVEFQSQNAHMFGQPRRAIEEDGGEFEYDDNSVAKQRHAMELEFGITPRLKSRVGIEFEKERVDDPDSPSRAGAYEDLKLTEIGGELIVILDPIEDDDDWGFGLVTEYEHALEDGEASTLLFGTIIQTNQGPWWGNVNLYLVKHLGGERPRDEKLDFAYASQFGYHLNTHWHTTIEAYGTVDRLGNTGRRGEEGERFGDHDQHRVGPLLYYTTELGDGDDELGLLVGAGFLFGLNENTPNTTFKWTVEVEF